MDDAPKEEEFRRVMGDAARRMVGSTESPYWDGIQLMGDMTDLMVDHVLAGGAFRMWAYLTDAIDAPPSMGLHRGLVRSEIEDLMRLASQEWLDLEPTPDNVRAYLRRWEDWEYIGRPGSSPPRHDRRGRFPWSRRRWWRGRDAP